MDHPNIFHPIVVARCNDVDVRERMASVYIFTDDSLPYAIAHMAYAPISTQGKKDDAITMTLTNTDADGPLFTGTVSTIIHGPQVRTLVLSDGYKKLLGTTVLPAYRNERADVILNDTLALAGITDLCVSCPDVVIARFSAPKISAAECIMLLVQALKEHSYTAIRFFFTATGTFVFGDAATVIATTEYTFSSKKNIFRRGDGWIEVFPVPVRQAHVVRIDGREARITRTELIMSRTRSRLRIWSVPNGY